MAEVNNNTFSRLVAFSMRWARGELAHRMTSVVAGVIPDAIADGARQVMRAMLPLPGSMPDAVPSMLRRFGLPPYMPGVITYAAQLIRLQAALDTQAFAGSYAQMLAELVSIGIASPDIDTTGVEASGFFIATTDFTPTIVGSWTIGDDTSIGATATDVAKTRSVVQMLEYFKPAADRFEGFKAP
jgi:hypothetical protein